MERPRATLLLTATLVLTTLLSGCVSTSLNPFNDDGVYAVVSAPAESGGMTIFVLVERTLQNNDGQANYLIRFGDEIVYPPGGLGGTIPVTDGRGMIFIPYDLFVVGNGKYEVEVEFGGDRAIVPTEVEKWVNYVYLHPYDRGNKIVIDAQLSRATGGAPSGRILAEGELLLQLRYRGQNGEQDRSIGQPIRAITDPDQSFVRVEVPRSAFSSGSGYYSVEPVFHNYQAKGNLWVGPDPAMAQRSPPWNWIYVQR